MIVIDEAGDLGSGSKYFVLAGVTTTHSCKNEMEEVLKETKVKKFHFINDSKEVREKLVNRIAKMNLKVTIYVSVKEFKKDEGTLLSILLRNLFPDDEKILDIMIDNFLNNERIKRDLENKLKYETARFFNKPW